MANGPSTTTRSYSCGRLSAPLGSPNNQPPAAQADEHWSGQTVTMYSQLLETALAQVPTSEHPSSAGDALVELIRCRSRLTKGVSIEDRSEMVPAAVAVQLAYDVALVELTRRLGLDFDLSAFDQPLKQRSRLEGALLSRGIDVESFDGQAITPPE